MPLAAASAAALPLSATIDSARVALSLSDSAVSGAVASRCSGAMPPAATTALAFTGLAMLASQHAQCINSSLLNCTLRVIQQAYQDANSSRRF